MASNADLRNLQTEERNPRSTDVDTVSTAQLCDVINQEDSKIAAVVKSCIPTIAAAIDAIAPRVRTGGRVIYVGAGTSGRLGVLDSSEIPPTFSASPSQFVGLIAGGDVALRSAKEGAEDSLEGAVDDLSKLDIKGNVDCLIGIAASGRTPYVLSSLHFAKSKGCLTIGIACSAPSSMSESGDVDFMINVVTGPEVVTGSTRMKAGTATKLVLNMLSTGVMIKNGKTFGNIMIDVKPTNVKLQIRARRILRQICGDQCPSTDAELDAILQEADKSVKLAAAMILLDIGVNEARAKLEEVDGVLSLLLRGSQGSANSHVRDCVTKVPLVLCVDGGGSKCRATIAAVNGQTWTGEAGPCNPSDLGVEGAIGAIDQAVQAAINSYSTTSGLRMEHINFSKVWVGLAGIDREPTRSRIRLELEKLLGEPSCSNMAVSNDLELLATIGGHRFGAKDVIVLVAGTGSIAMRYNIQGNKCQKVARVGGWGALLGDDGSGFDIGKKTIRMVLAELDRGANISDFEEAVDPLSRLVMDHFRPATIPADWNDLLNAILLGERQDKQPASYVKQRIAGLAEVIVSLVNVSHKASKIVDDAVRGLSDLVSCVLARPSASQRNTVLVVAGGLMQSNVVRSKLCVKLVDEKIYSGRIESVEDLATSGALFLAQEQGRGSAVVGSA